MNLQLNNPQRLVGVNIHQLQDKCKSKKELYQFLTQDCGAFLPRIQSTNIYFFKQIVRGQKENFILQYLKRDAVKVSAVPHIEGLTIEEFIEFAKQKPQLLRYLPDQRDWVHMDRQWICDVLYTLDHDGIQEKIKQALKQRKEKLEQNRDLLVQMRPEFVQALNNCLNFSHERGRSANLLKDSSKRKRLRSELEDVQQEENELKENKQEFLQEVKRLKREKEELQQQVIVLSQVNEEYSQLYGHEEQPEQQVQYQI